MNLLKNVMVTGVVLFCAAVGAAQANHQVASHSAGFQTQAVQQRTVTGERYIPGIWVDPDGCEHWVMDGGLEGFMSSHLDREGKPVCRGTSLVTGACRTLDNAALFDIGSASLKPSAREELKTYFATIAGKSVVVSGHTDNSGSEKANLALSLRRATVVAKIARAQGVNAEARGYGEQVPIAPNDTAEGRARNRRVELSCS